jgi:hypothetical protein
MGIIPPSALYGIPTRAMRGCEASRVGAPSVLEARDSVRIGP